MKIENDAGNLVYDDSNPDCAMIISECQGELYAFVTALDIGSSASPLKKPMKARYWGKFSWSNKENAIREILHTGGKWPDLG